MINTLQIEGFQSHDSTEIELSKGVNVIIGSSDSGKSSIIRACKWAFQNRPQGDSFRNNLLEDKDECSVCAIFEDDSYILRQKMKGTNSYLVDDVEYKALRSDVPKNVQDITLMKDVNIQSQHPSDQYFLLTDSPGQVAKKFNEVAGLQIMDKAMFKINSFVRECKSQSKVYDTEIDSKKVDLKTLSWVPKAQKEAEALAKFSEEIDICNDDICDIDDTLHNITFTEKELEDFETLDVSISAFDKLKALSLKHSTKNLAAERVKNLILDVKNLDKRIKIYESISSAQTAFKSLDSFADSFRNLASKHLKIEGVIENLVFINSDIQTLDTEIKSLDRKFTTKLQTENCPVCGRSA